jgi:hypothetical protein
MEVPVNLRSGTGAGPRQSSRWLPHPALVLGVAAAIVTGTCFTAGYFVHRAKDAVVAAYASHETLFEQGYAVGVGKDTPVSRQPTAAEKALAQTPLKLGQPAPGAAAKANTGVRKSPSKTSPIAPKTPEIQLERRVAGLYYFNLADYLPSTAKRLVEFWKANGLDAEAISDDNAGLVQVIDLRGFTEEQVGSADFVKHERTLRDLGRKWKSQEKGPNALDHMNAAKFTGNTAAPKPAARLKKD